MCKESMKCKTCTKKCLARKDPLHCSLCGGIFHPKCIDLTPHDVSQMSTNRTLLNWYCLTCTAEALPFMNNVNTDFMIEGTQSVTNISPRARINCNTCGKLGNISKMLVCWICDHYSHAKCSAGDLGCKCCMRESYPGYNVTPRSLHAVYGHQANSATFNPYHRTHDSNYIGNRSDDDVDFNPWENCSDILDSCKYYEPRQIHASKSYELKVQSLNIRSLHSAMSSLRDSIEQYTKFDILCFNETNCIAENLAFKGKELELEGFHAPFIQAPARESGRGGGLAVYVNKNLCDLSDIQIKDELSSRDDAKSGEFQVIEITHKNHKNTILCNMYRSPSGNLASFIEKLECTLKGLARHSNKNIFFLGDSNINLLEYGKMIKLLDMLTFFQNMDLPRQFRDQHVLQVTALP